MFARKKIAAAPALSSDQVEAGAGYSALRFLSEQGLDHSPTNFALAWQLKTDRHGMAAIAVDAILMEGRSLTKADVDRIMLASVQGRQGAAASNDPRQDALRHQTLRLADLAAGAAATSSNFERDLSAEVFQLSGGADSVTQIVKAMVQRTQGVEAQLNAASKEIEELRQQVEVTRDDAQRDALTGLLNRRGASQLLAERCRSAAATIALCDIDHFKSINDRFGHSVGDRVLKAAAASLSESVGDHTIARWGGEEFLIIIDGMTLDDAALLLERMRAALEMRSFRTRDSEEEIGTVTISVGAAALRGSKLGDAIDLADRRLYEAKRGGRNRVVTELPRTV